MKITRIAFLAGLILTVITGMLFYAQVQRAEQTKILSQTQMLMAWNSRFPAGYINERTSWRRLTYDLSKVQSYQVWAKKRIEKFYKSNDEPIPEGKTNVRNLEGKSFNKNAARMWRAAEYLFPIDPLYLEVDTVFSLQTAIQKVVMDLVPESKDPLSEIRVLARFEAETKYKTPNDQLDDTIP